MDDLDEEDNENNAMPSLLKGPQRTGSAVRNGRENSMLSRTGGQLGKGVTPFMRKKENLEDKARIMDL